MHYDLMFWGLAALSVLAALAYGLMFLGKPPSIMRAAVKTTMMAALALGLWHVHAPALLLVAAAASAVGDAFLAFDKKWVLPLGILSFLLAQLAYLVLFRQLSGAQEPLLLRYAAMALLFATAIGFLVWLWPKLAALAFGVVPYSAAITAMAMQAMLLPWSAWPTMLGVVSFFISDGVLSAELFRLPPDAPARRITGPIVWWTYAGAQMGMIWGVLGVTQAALIMNA